jgi:hypothetical protein
VPGNVAARNCVFHRLAFGGGGLIEVLEQQPRSGRPYIAPLAAGVRGARSLNGLGEVLIEVLMNDVVLRIDKAGACAPAANKALGRNAMPAPTVVIVFTKSRRFIGKISPQSSSTKFITAPDRGEKRLLRELQVLRFSRCSRSVHG